MSAGRRSHKRNKGSDRQSEPLELVKSAHLAKGKRMQNTTIPAVVNSGSTACDDAVADAIAENIDISDFADPHVEAIRIDAAARGDARRLAAIKGELHTDASRGWCTILMMTDEWAIVQWHDKFLITITDPTTVEMIEAMAQVEVGHE